MITAAEVINGDTSNDGSISLTFTSSEATTNFTSDDVSVTNGALSAFSSSSSTVYTATFTPSGDGTCAIDVGGDVYTDNTGNGNDASNQFTWTYDGAQPLMTITAEAGKVVFSGDASNDASLSLTFTSSESTTDFVSGDVTVANGTLSNFAATSSTLYTATFTPTSDGVCTIDVAAAAFTDPAGNDNVASLQFTWTSDSTSPTMTIAAAEVTSGETSDDALLSLTFTSSESTTDFISGDVTVANGTLSNFAATSSTVYTATFTPTSEGACTIDVASNVYTDAVGNGNDASVQFAWTYDSPYVFTDATIQGGVDDWVADPVTATATYGEISTWDVSQVTNMSSLFANKTTFNDDISAWDVSNVTTMEYLFAGAELFNQPLNSWNVSNVTNMNFTFEAALAFNLPLSDWNVGNVTNMQGMFYNASSFDQPLTWVVSEVVNMHQMFMHASSFNQSLNWDVSKVEDMMWMFHTATSFNGDISNWDVSSVDTMVDMFGEATSFNQPLNWNLSNGPNLSGMFYGATSFNQPLNHWDVSNVTNMLNLFMNATSFNQPLNWDVSSVTTMLSMFHGATSFNQPLNDWNVSGGPITAFMFVDATSFNQPLNDWDVSNITHLIQMFKGATSFNQTLSTWDVSSVTSMTDMLDNSALSVDNYDATLNAWALLPVQPNITLGADGITFCAGESARQSLIDAHNWVMDDGGANCPPMTIYDFMIGQQVGSELFITELFQKAINHLNTTTGANPSFTLMEFLEGTAINNEIYMEYDLQAIVDAINAGGVLGCTQPGSSNYNEIATVDDGSCCPTINQLALVSANSGCSGDDGAIDITVNDDEPSTLYTVAWSGPNNFSSQTEDLTGLESGSYSVTITDDNSCTAVATFDVEQEICFGNL